MKCRKKFEIGLSSGLCFGLIYLLPSVIAKYSQEIFRLTGLFEFLAMLVVRSRFFADLSKRAMATSASLLSESPVAKNTVNEAEVSKFRQLSESWWDPNGPLNGLHSMNRLRVPFIRDGLVHTGQAQAGVAKPLEGLSILVSRKLIF